MQTKSRKQPNIKPLLVGEAIHRMVKRRAFSRNVKLRPFTEQLLKLGLSVEGRP